MQWQKKIPLVDGKYWCCYKKPNHEKRVTICSIGTISEEYENTDNIPKFDKKGRAIYGMYVDIQEGGYLPIHKGQTENQARKVFGFKELLFWPVLLTPPKLPK